MRASGIQRVLVGILLVALTCAPYRAVHAQGPGTRARSTTATRPEPVTEQAWSATEGGATTELLVVLKAQATLPTALPGVDRALQAQRVQQSLWQTAQNSQRSLRAWLEARHVSYRAFYIVNALLVRGDRALLQDLAGHADIARIMTNPRVAIDPQPTPFTVDPAATQSITTIEWGIERIGAPHVWAMGYTGAGVVVAGQDTGYQWDHPALRAQYRGWNGTGVDHNYNWHDAIHETGSDCPPDGAAPCDDNGHGTHTMGTIIGDDGGTNQIGVAPGARWIGCRNMREGVGTPGSYIECFEFFLAPYPVGGNPAQGDPSRAPHIINNSWSCPTTEGCDAAHITLMELTVNAVRAAGIMVVASAGNTGPTCGTVNTPPGMYDATYTIGATSSDALDTIASFSSRGASAALVKPDIAAPGVTVRSSYIGSGYTTMSGTSMASPHVAGAVALLWSARPDLIGEVTTTEFLLNATAVARTSTQCGDAVDAVPNDVYGWGRVDALSAVRTALEGTLVGVVHDQNVDPLPNVTVRAVSVWAETFLSQSDSAGAFVLKPISGTYTVTASLSGYGTVTYIGIAVSPGYTTTLSVQLTELDRVFLPMVLR